MTKEFKKITIGNETRYVIESMTASATGAGAIATSISELGELQKRLQELKDKVPQKPRQGPLRPQTGAGVHKNKKKDQQRGIEKHKGQSVYQEEFNGEYDDEAGMVKNNIHTIVRVMRHLEGEIADNENLPEWVQEKIASAKGMLVSVMDYMLSQHEMGIAPKQDMAEESSENKYDNLSNRGVNRGINRAGDDFNRMLDLDQAGSPKHQQNTKQRLKTKPMAGPKGVLPEQGGAEGQDRPDTPESMARILLNRSRPPKDGSGNHKEVGDAAMKELFPGYPEHEPDPKLLKAVLGHYESYQSNSGHHYDFEGAVKDHITSKVLGFGASPDVRNMWDRGLYQIVSGYGPKAKVWANLETIQNYLYKRIKPEKLTGLNPEQGVAEGEDDDISWMTPKQQQEFRSAYAAIKQHPEIWKQYQHYTIQDLKNEFPNQPDQELKYLTSVIQHGLDVNDPNHVMGQGRAVRTILQWKQAGQQGVAEGFDQSPEYELLQGRIGEKLIGYYNQGYTEEEIRKMQGAIAQRLGYEPDDKMFRSAFNAVLTSPEQGAEEGTDDSTQVLSDIVANDDFDVLYDLMSSDTEAGKIVQRMYNDVSGEERLHPDDDFEEILSIVLDRLTQDYGQQGVAEESDFDLSSSTKRDLIANFKQAWQGGAVSVDRAIEDAMRPLLNVGVLKKSEIDAAKEFLDYVADMEQQPEEPYHDRDEDPMLGIYEGKIKGADGKACWKGKRYTGTKNGKDICIPVGETDQYMTDLSEKLNSVISEKAPPGDKYERMVKHIKKGYAKDGKLTDVEKRKAYGAAWKAKNQKKK